MKITIFGFIWLLLIIYCFFSKDEKKMIFLTLLSAILQCDVVIVLGDSNSAGPLIVTSIIFIFWYILKNLSNYLLIFDKTTIFSIFLLASVIISLIYNGQSIFGDKLLYIIQLFVYMACFWCMRKIGIKRKIEIDKLFVSILYIVLIIGVIQFLINAGVLPKLSLITNLFFNETWNPTNAYNNPTSKLRLFSTFKEPSYCATFLVGAFYYVSCNYNKIKNSIPILIAILMEILLTLSTTAYVALIIEGIIFTFLSHKQKLLKFLLPLGIITLIITSSSGILNTVVLKKSSTGSAAERNMWNKNSLDSFKTSPIFGTGYKSSRASSIVYNLLSCMGLIGIISFSLFIWNYLRRILKKDTENNYACLYFFLGVVIGQIISCPDLELSVFWLGLYLIGLSEKIYENRKEEYVEKNSICNYNKL